MHPSIIKTIKAEIAKVDKPENRLDYSRFFKLPPKERFGIKTAMLRKISNACFKEVKSMPKDEVLDVCDELLSSGMRYGRFFAFEWAIKMEKQYEQTDFKRFERWHEKYVGDWGACDHLCGATGRLILRYPALSSKARKWAKSKNMWMRRASAVSLIVPVKNGILLDDVFKTADILLMDGEDLVQKGYGWMLKEAAERFPDEVFAYVMKHKDKMPRTSLRYAIEKYPEKKRKEAMA